MYRTRFGGRDVVAKRLKAENAGSAVLKELAALCAVPRHERICPLLCVCLEPDVYFVSPFVANGSLKQLLDKTRSKQLGAAAAKAIGVLCVFAIVADSVFRAQM